MEGRICIFPTNLLYLSTPSPSLPVRVCRRKEPYSIHNDAVLGDTAGRQPPRILTTAEPYSSSRAAAEAAAAPPPHDKTAAVCCS